MSLIGYRAANVLEPPQQHCRRYVSYKFVLDGQFVAAVGQYLSVYRSATSSSELVNCPCPSVRGLAGSVIQRPSTMNL